MTPLCRRWNPISQLTDQRDAKPLMTMNQRLATGQLSGRQQVPQHCTDDKRTEHSRRRLVNTQLVPHDGSGRWCRRQHKRIGAARSLSVCSCFWEAKNSGIDSGKQKLLFLVTLGLWLICTKMTYKLHRHRREHLKQIWTFVDFHWSVITTHIYSFIINKSFDRPQHNICNTRMLNVVFTQHVNKCQNRVL